VRAVLIGLALGVAWFLGGALAPEEAAETCRTQDQPVRVDQDGEVYQHAQEAIAEGWPRLLTVDRDHAVIRRQEALAGIPTKPGVDRDEYPPAMSAEGGGSAHVAYVDRSENRAQGASMGWQLGPYCDGQAFLYVDVPGR
jgi:Deoxyribonuclease NucA/NucB